MKIAHKYNLLNYLIKPESSPNVLIYIHRVLMACIALHSHAVFIIVRGGSGTTADGGARSLGVGQEDVCGGRLIFFLLPQPLSLPLGLQARDSSSTIA